MTGKSTDLEQQLKALHQAYMLQLAQDLPLLQQSAALLPQLSAPERQARIQELYSKLHTLAGSAGTFGLPQLGVQAKLLEQQLKRWLQTASAVTAAEQDDFIRHIQQLNISAVEVTPQVVQRTEIVPAAMVSIYVLCSEPVLTEQISTMLDIFGYSYHRFSDIDALAVAVSTKRPDVLVIDLDDTHQVANTCIKRLAELQAAQKSPVPVLLLSNQSDFGSYLNAVRIGVIGYFIKPLNITELETHLRQHLSRSEREPFRVLLVDDDQLLAEHYALVLRQGGLLVEVLSEPALIFEALKQFHPDVILLDVNMPFCSGPELAQLVRLQQAWLGVPIIYLSSETDSEQQLAALIKAGDDFITKPITDTALLVAVFSRAQRARQLADIMTRDSLTGLLQHAHIKERLGLEILRSQRSTKPVSVVMLDIDHFKKVNDNYGHLVGDQVIASLANLLKQQLRKTDLVGRYGGEEFLLVLPDCNTERAFKVVEQMRELFAALPFTAAGQRFFCTFSAGLSTAMLKQTDLVIEQADQALYRAKSSGRNCTVLAAT